MSRRQPSLVSQWEFDKFREERRQEIISLRPRIVEEQLREIKNTHPDIYRWIENVEHLNTMIWCDKCKKRNEDHRCDPSIESPREASKHSWLT